MMGPRQRSVRGLYFVGYISGAGILARRKTVLLRQGIA